MSDWRATETARAAAATRNQLESLDRAITEVSAQLAVAQEFEGFFAKEIEAVERQISSIDTAISTDSAGWPSLVRRPNDAGKAELARLRGVRQRLEEERDAQKRAKTVESRGQLGQPLSHCLLSSADMVGRLHHLRIVRGRVAEQLRELEEKCTPGQLVQSGMPAPDYTQYVKRVEDLRYGPGVVIRGGSAA